MGWHVYLHDQATGEDKEIDKVFFLPSCDADYVLRSLIEHDGYDPGITVMREDL
jgi:hypothetical protein